MKYLVTIESIVAPPVSSQENVHLLEVVISHLDAFVKLEAEGKVLASGIYPGARAGVSIIDVTSNEELDQLLMSIPGWELFKIDVKPLQSYEGRIKIARRELERLKAE